MSINRWKDKQDVVHIYNGILLSHKKEWNNAIFSNMDATQDHYTKWSKKERQRQILDDITYGGSEVKASAFNAGDLGSIPGSGRSPGEGNGNPLQYSCLQNPITRGAWQITVHRVAQNRARQKWLSMKHTRYNMVFIFLFLTYFTYDNLQFHPCCCKWHYSILFMTE